MKYVYSFDEGNKDMREILGGKGANLAEMTKIGLPVPRGFTISTTACNDYYKNNQKIDSNIVNEILMYINKLEQITNKKFGNPDNPLLVSVRSGSRASMPGMMDTILNLGINDTVATGLIKVTNDPRFVCDAYRRFISMYADVVNGYDKNAFENLFSKIKNEKGAVQDTDLDANGMFEVVQRFKTLYKQMSGHDFPQDPKYQLLEAVAAVFKSWNNERAIVYREMNKIPSDWGTAVNVQEMVYGNMGNTSGTGVAFTRNPANGENGLYGEYLMNAQGEDVVAGIRTPKSIDTLKQVLPDVYEEFLRIAKTLESHYKDMQDMEFTIEKGKLFMLQTRNGKRTAEAALKIAVDMVNEGLISKEEALMRVEVNQLDQLLHDTFDDESLSKTKVIAKGLAASPGAACGKIYFNATDVTKATLNKEKAILVRKETSPEDIVGMKNASGILTVHGGMTSHAAVVARGMGRCCICGCSSIVVDENNKTITLNDGTILHEGDYISLDGKTGNVYLGEIKTKPASLSGNFKIFMDWADSIKKLKVRANADTEHDALVARNFGALGIGLCRTEHMFFDKDRIFNFRMMITAPDLEKRKMALSKILPYQRNDFEKLFEVMNGYPVVIRYLDPPLHEFLPKTDTEIQELANSLNMNYDELKTRIDSLKEFNPMMGHRGCRLSVTYPEIAVMQTTAVISAAINVMKKGIKVIPEIMIPLITDTEELKYVKNIISNTANTIIKQSGVDLKYMIGTMIEIPRATLIADKLAKETDFFSFGTNDLTQLTYGFSRDDAGKFLNDYYNKHIFEQNPFESIDEEGVGQLVGLGVTLGKKANPNIELGICGEHAGEEKSIDFCHRVGLDYVSCSPYRVPMARLAAAKAAIREKENK
ncbi:MAG: pyruvate, phosphate dikinase [Bacilli bacterium]|nr:pyruvate, phosphate dikinase [Bacilli bacterium]